MSVTFAVKVPNDDDGEYLGTCTATALPRVGDDFYIEHPRLQGKSSYPFEGIVDAVQWEVTINEEQHLLAIGVRSLIADIPTVWIRERAQAPKLYCVCTDEGRANVLKGHETDPEYVDKDGLCFDCGSERP